MAPQSPTSQHIERFSVRWNDEETRKIITWLSERDEEGIRNLDSWITGGRKGSKQVVAKKMLIATGLITRPGVTSIKAAAKIRVMIDRYKYQRMQVERAGWSVDPRCHEELVNTTAGRASIKQHILSNVWWYYQLDDLFHRPANVDAACNVESEVPEPDRVGSQEPSAEDSDEDMEVERIDMSQPATTFSEQELEGGIKLEFDDNEDTAIAGDSELQDETRNFHYFLRSLRAEGTTIPNVETTSRLPTPLSSAQKSQKGPIIIAVDSESKMDANYSQKRKRCSEPLSIAAALVAVEQIRERARVRAEEKEERRFKIAMKQRDQHHKSLMMKYKQRGDLQEQIVLCLKLQLQRQERGRSDPLGASESSFVGAVSEDGEFGGSDQGLATS